ncbi:hypothetical protein D8T51_00900 [Vibrio vulnificus]|nr:dTDP-4-keto-6-deoxy-D-glucose epimerase [Vibrio vulnificus]EGR0354198.1 dTDP-4-keto-6-deoxy-D-glucose epimerase [Vibrio vulnificus]EGR0642205.1 hypothetical protein [Vibrio vulnificus]EGR0651383.1 hypothetical protein [Vibrio vulnificus]EHH0804940.1 dTDP-4-keto-6-deoxy-D-glucose epimerase [Vibrio vulnificus]
MPEGFAHGFYVTSESADFVYKCTYYYNLDAEQSIAWNDQSIGVRWPIVIGKEPMLSKKDALDPNLSECKYLLG